MKTIFLLFLSNAFMTFAWYGHLKTMENKPLTLAILVSWGIAFFEYCFQVPANRIGYKIFTLGELKIIQEIVTMITFAAFSYFYMQKPLSLNYLYAALCMIGAAYFIFRDSLPVHG
ncbi:MAG: DMT family protein [Pseudomonadota bacterium]|nr:DMT family protein [Pseudomonadota bacterium]